MESSNSANPHQESLPDAEPLVFKDIISQMVQGNKWSCLRWTKADWQHCFREEKFKMRINRIRKNGKFSHPQWESQCVNSQLKFKDLLAFDDGYGKTIDGRIYNCKDYWMYFSYFYLRDLENFQFLDHIISWQDFGLKNLSGKDSTLWIGTAGANTPCHIDTYGWNIVVQLYGSKRWTLFPQSQLAFLYRTRIPYEESSIYSEAGFPFPDLERFPLLYKTTPYLVVLQPGDVLIVPKHWWHFVECLSFSISINTWIPSKTDSEDRLKEAIAMFQMGSLSRTLDSAAISEFLNPNMFHVALSSSEELMETLLNAVNSIDINSVTNHDIIDIKGVIDHLKCKGLTCSHNVDCHSFESYCRQLNITYNVQTAMDHRINGERNVLKSITNTFLDERVLSCMMSILLEKLNSTR